MRKALMKIGMIYGSKLNNDSKLNEDLKLEKNRGHVYLYIVGHHRNCTIILRDILHVMSLSQDLTTYFWKFLSLRVSLPTNKIKKPIVTQLITPE